MTSLGGIEVVIGITTVAWLAVLSSPSRTLNRRRLREQRARERLQRQQAATSALARHWTDAVAYCRRSANGFYRPAGLAHVILVYGAYPRRGTKAVIQWYGGSGWRQDTWFEQAWPRAGDWLIISGCEGYGPHSQNPRTFYAQILGVVPAGAWEAYHGQIAAGQLPAVGTGI